MIYGQGLAINCLNKNCEYLDMPIFKIILKTLSPLILAWSLASCSSDSNPQDYWEFPEPQVHIWEEAETQIFEPAKKLTLPLKEYSKLNRGFTISYPSFVEVRTLEEDRFRIVSTCKKRNNSYSKTFDDIKINKKILFYNFLPSEVIADTQLEPKGSDLDPFRCDFKFRVINKIGSYKDFDIPQVLISTAKPNNIWLSAKATDQIFNITSKIDKNKLTWDFINFSDQNTLYYAKFGQNDDGKYFDLLHPKILCSSNIKIEDSSNKNDRYFEMDMQSFFSKINKDHLPILRKCRIVAQLYPYEIDKHQPLKSGYNDLPVVWSPYFDALFKNPRLQAKVEMEYNPEAYPGLPTQTTPYTVAQIRIQNTGEVPLIVELPTAKVEGKLSAMSFAGGKKEYVDYALRKHQKDFLPNTLYESDFSSNIYLRFSEPPFDKAMIGINQTKDINVIIDKNFVCFFKNLPLPESALWVKGIKKHTEEELLKLSVQNFYGEVSVPIEYYLSQMLRGQNNILEPTEDSSYLVDSVFIPYVKGTPVDATYDYASTYHKLITDRLPAFIGAKPRRFKKYKDYVHRYQHTRFNEFCRVF